MTFKKLVQAMGMAFFLSLALAGCMGDGGDGHSHSHSSLQPIAITAVV